MMVRMRPFSVSIALCAAILTALIAGMFVRPHAVSIDAPPLNEHAAPAQPATAAFDTIVDAGENLPVGSADVVVPAHRRVTLFGWAIPYKAAWSVVGIEASRDGGPRYAGRYGLQRPGLAAALARPDAATAGFTVPIDTGSPGTRVIRLDLLLSNGARTPVARAFRLRVVPQS
jgi:hypothetical protein